MILCSKLRVQVDWVSGLAFMWIWSALAANFSLSVFKCCLALLILSGKLEHKSSKSSFILMSQVLNLLKSEYWNGLELGTFKGLRIHSACGADLGWENEFFPPETMLVLHSSFSLLLWKAFSFSSHTFAESRMLSDKSFMVMQSGEGGVKSDARDQDSSNRHLVLVACRTELFASFEV